MELISLLNQKDGVWSTNKKIALIKKAILWAEQDSDLRRRMPADLQSAPVDRFGIDP